MNLVSFCFITAAGVVVSVKLLREHKQQVDNIEYALDFALYMREQIEVFKLPLAEILNNYISDRSADGRYFNSSLEDFTLNFSKVCNDDSKARRLIASIMDGNYQQAVSGSSALVYHLKELLNDMKNDYDSKKRMKAVLPVACGMLIGILMI